MTRDEAVKMLQATRLMLMDGANQPISDLYYALDMAIEALEQTEPTNSEKPNNCEDEDIFEYCPRCGMRILVSKPKTEPQTDCKSCKYHHEEWFGEECDSCCEYSDWQPKDEPTISKMEQVDKDINVRSKDEPQTDIHDLTDCDFCKDRNCKDCEGGKDEPQTERKNLCGKQICDHLFDDDCALKTDCAWK